MLNLSAIIDKLKTPFPYAGLLIITGIFMLLFQYFGNPSLWFDEAQLALNLISKSPLELTQALDNNQAAPIGFLLLTKFFVLLFGNSEYILRIIPISASIGSIFLFYHLLKKYAQPFSVIIGLILLIFSMGFIRYSNEFKQYSSDIFVALFLQLFGLSLFSKRMTLKLACQFGLLGILASFFSFTTVFILLGTGITLAFKLLWNKSWDEFRYFLISIGMWCMGFAALYFISLSNIDSGGEAYVSYWAKNFMPMPIKSIQDLNWLFSSFHDLFWYPGSINAYILAEILFLVGCYQTFQEKKYILGCFLLPLFLTLLASGFRLYPFFGRLLLFYIPFLYFFIAEGLSCFMHTERFRLKIIGSVIFAILIFHPLIVLNETTSRIMSSEEIKPVLKYIKKHYRPNDKIYVYTGAIPAFRYYAKSYGLNNLNYTEGIGSRNNPEKYKEDFDQFKGNDRVWVLFSHVYVKGKHDEAIYLLKYLTSVAESKDFFGTVGSGVYLFDFSGS